MGGPNLRVVKGKRSKIASGGWRRCKSRSRVHISAGSACSSHSSNQQALSAGSRRRAGRNEAGVPARPPRSCRDEPDRAELGLRYPRPGNAGARSPRAAVPRTSGRYFRRSALVRGADPLRGRKAVSLSFSPLPRNSPDQSPSRLAGEVRQHFPVCS